MPTFNYDDAKHEYSLTYKSGRVEILPSVTAIIESHGFINDYSRQAYAALRGNMVHLAAQYLFQGRLDWKTVDSAILGYCKSLEEWIHAIGFVADDTEIRMWHPLLKFAGTCDVIGRTPDNFRWLIDLKTGVEAQWHHWQTAGYLILDGGYARRGSLYLRKSGKIANFKEHTDEQDEVKFISMLNVMRMKEERR